MSKSRRRRHTNVPVHSGAVHSEHPKVRPESSRFGMIVQNTQFFTIPQMQPDFRCAECSRSWHRETNTIAISSEGERQLVRLSGWWECCQSLFKWGDQD